MPGQPGSVSIDGVHPSYLARRLEAQGAHLRDTASEAVVGLVEAWQWAKIISREAESKHAQDVQRARKEARQLLG